jgi:uncharacterized protein YuzE
VIVRYDTDADATYITLRVARVARTTEVVDSFVWVDMDEQGDPTGVEILAAPADIDDTAMAPLAQMFPSLDIDKLKVALAGHALRPAI